MDQNLFNFTGVCCKYVLDSKRDSSLVNSMIIIDVHGGTNYQKLVTYQVINYCINDLMPRIQNIDISVRITRKLEVHGYCTELNDREFDIEVLGTQMLRQFVMTLCHEMVHVRQKVNGEEYDENEAILEESRLCQAIWEADIL